MRRGDIVGSCVDMMTRAVNPNSPVLLLHPFPNTLIRRHCINEKSLKREARCIGVSVLRKGEDRRKSVM
jgi:hypothetical protein